MINDQKFKRHVRLLKPQLERPSRSEPLLPLFCVRTTRRSREIRKLFPPWGVCWSRMNRSADNPLIYFARDAYVNIGCAVLVPYC